MKAIVYISQENRAFTHDDLDALLSQAVDQNRNSGVTGYLHYESGYFMQYFEGEAEPVSETFRRIERDKRHTIFYHSEENDLLERRFPDWHMQWGNYELETDIAQAISQLEATLKPFELVLNNKNLERAYFLYRQIAQDQSLRQLASLKGENEELASVLSMAVHDLRSPIKSIDAIIDMYVEDVGERVDKELIEATSYIKRTTKRMDDLIIGILDHFSSDVSSTNEEIDVGSIVEEISQMVEFEKGSISISVNGEMPVIFGSKNSIWRVLNCLVTNALKYNRSGTPQVEISAERDGHYWQFCVSDNGIGIDPKHQQRIFEIFRRLHTDNVFPGSGVGLATCRKIVEGWHGRIWVSSELGEGSRFYFTHPAS